ncbi:uncharacterized protein DSM5745_03516 [Aspergillus mulundensis]|uniref:Uncharacterized protein n=1 Tax=Aspergillus mulundensis TaxID=1810919 RepID=A0A3D8SKZ5_9EURO|nr:hypothetical protein DSM5745_03516 [Aspergillus mulundensis]RDW86874.1 hypothetical protein DSM5745_03516 [Aspergillus mulundensis]
MGANQRVKTKYVFRLPIPFLKTKRINVKGDRVEDEADDTDEGVYANAGANVPHTVRVRYNSGSGSESDSEMESEVGSVEYAGVDMDTNIDPLDTSVPTPSRHRHTQRKRLISWDGVREQGRSRWTIEQEEKLAHARVELARCQKAWSSEQEIWLQCIDNLVEEKTAHEGFLSNRRKHSSDEQVHFRTWPRTTTTLESGPEDDEFAGAIEEFPGTELRAKRDKGSVRPATPGGDRRTEMDHRLAIREGLIGHDPLARTSELPPSSGD